MRIMFLTVWKISFDIANGYELPRLKSWSHPLSFFLLHLTVNPWAKPVAPVVYLTTFLCSASGVTDSYLLAFPAPRLVSVSVTTLYKELNVQVRGTILSNFQRFQFPKKRQVPRMCPQPQPCTIWLPVDLTHSLDWTFSLGWLPPASPDLKGDNISGLLYFVLPLPNAFPPGDFMGEISLFFI